MPTDISSSKGLSAFWRPNSRRSSKSPQPQAFTSGSDGLLVPQSTLKSTDSEDSKSTKSAKSERSDTSRGRKLFRQISNRLRSSSSVCLDVGPLQEKDFREIEGWIDGFDKYNQLITNQVSKDRDSKPEDFIRICKALTKSCGGAFVHGLPEAMFDLSLLWCPAERMNRKPVDDREPSWSWTGWTGAINYPFDPTNSPDVRKIEGNFFKSEIINYHLGPHATHYTIRREKKRIRIQYPSYFHAPFGHDSSTDSNTLRFTAQTIPVDGFNIVQLLDADDNPMACSELMNAQNQHCGVIMDYRDLLCAHLSEPSAFEFVLLSRNRRCEPSANTRRPTVSTAHPPGTPIWNGERFLWDQQIPEFDEEVFADREWSLLNVMLIQHLSEGYAERVAVARIHEDAWNAQKPARKDIVLR